MQSFRRLTVGAAHYLQQRAGRGPWVTLRDEWSHREIVFAFDFEADAELARLAGYHAHFGETQVLTPALLPGKEDTSG